MLRHCFSLCAPLVNRCAYPLLTRRHPPGNATAHSQPPHENSTVIILFTERSSDGEVFQSVVLSWHDRVASRQRYPRPFSCSSAFGDSPPANPAATAVEFRDFYSGQSLYLNGFIRVYSGQRGIGASTATELVILSQYAHSLPSHCLSD